MDETDSTKRQRGRKPFDLTEKVIGECLVPVGGPIRENGNTYWMCGCLGGYQGAPFCISANADPEKRTKRVAYSSISAKRQFSCGCKQGRKGIRKDGTALPYIVRPATLADYEHARILHLCPDHLTMAALEDLGIPDLTETDTN